RQAVAVRLREPAAGRAQRRQRVVVDLAARHDRQPLVEQQRQRAQDARLRLAAQAEQDEVVARQDRVDDLGDDRVVVADDAGKERAARAQLADQVVADFSLDGPARDASGLDIRAQRAQRGRLGGHLWILAPASGPPGSDGHLATALLLTSSPGSPGSSGSPGSGFSRFPGSPAPDLKLRPASDANS